MSMGMGTLGGPPAGMNMNMNNGAGPRGPPSNADRAVLNTYIYDYFLKNNMVECARSLYSEAELQTVPNSRRNSPSRRAQKHDSDGNAVNGVDDNAMDTGEGPSQRKNDDPDDPNKGRADELPLPKVPADCPQGSFLFDWWCLFWDIFGARNGGGKGSNAAAAYVTQTQATQRFRQEQLLRMNPQQHALMTGQVPSQLMNMGPQYRNQIMQMQSGVIPNGSLNVQDGAGGGEMSIQQHKNLLARQAMLNNNRKTPLQIAGLKTQQHMMVQAAMQRENSEVNDMNGQQPRPQSPAPGHNAGSPKRIRLENGQYQEVGNGRGAPQGAPQSAASASQAHQLLISNGIDPNRLTPQQFQAFQGQNPTTQQKSIQLYAQSLAAHANRTVTALQGGPVPKGMQNQSAHGSPMMPQTSEGAPLGMSDFYATTPGGMRAGGMGAGTGNHALQDYQMQLMLLEQQNKKRLAMARAEQDSIVHHGDGQRRMEQGFSQSMSPGSRAAPSPQPPGNSKMAGTPKMPNQVGPGSPMPDGQMPGHAPQRNSPAAMGGFNGQIPQGAQQDMIYNDMKNSLGIIGNANPGAPNGATMMRPPPSSHPFAGQMTGEMNQMNVNLRAAQAGRGGPGSWQQQQVHQQQLQLQQQAAQQVQQQQQAQQQAQQQQPGGPQAGQTQAQIGTPQPARQNLQHQAMPPPPSVPPGAPSSVRTQPSSPQVASQQPPTPTQPHKANPKGKATRETMKKSRPKKNGGAAPQPTGPAGTPSSEPPTPTTPQHQNSFSQNPPRTTNFAPGQNAAGQLTQQPTPNPAHAAPPAPVPGPDVTPGFIENNMSIDFADFTDNPGDNLLDTFDFDSFLNTEDSGNGLSFDGMGWTDTVEASASES